MNNLERKLSEVRVATKEQKPKVYEEFIKEREEQIRFISKLGSDILREVKNNPETTSEELKGIFEKEIGEFKLYPKKRIQIYNAIERYESVHKEVNYLYDYGGGDGNSIVSDNLHFVPEGKVDAEKMPFVISLRFHNKEDYKKAYLNGKKDVNEHTTYSSDHSAGFYSPNRVFFIFSLSSSDDSTIKHEEQHALYHILTPVLENNNYKKKVVTDEELNSTIKDIKNENDPAEKEKLLSALLRKYVFQNVERAKDEIFAHFLRERSAKVVKLILFDHIYDFFYEDRKKLLEQLENKLNQKDFRMLSAEIRDKYYSLYRKIVSDGIDAYYEYISRGNNKNESFMRFIEAPLASWPRELERMNNYD